MILKKERFRGFQLTRVKRHAMFIIFHDGRMRRMVLVSTGSSMIIIDMTCLEHSQYVNIAHSDTRSVKVEEKTIHDPVRTRCTPSPTLSLPWKDAGDFRRFQRNLARMALFSLSISS